MKTNDAKPLDTSRLRGDYANVGSDYVITQDWSAYSEAEHDFWRSLYRRQLDVLPGAAAQPFVDGLRRIDCADGVPNLDRVNGILRDMTGFQLVAAPGIIPDDVFFRHIAERRFPVTTWLRRPEEAAYLMEPDIFHDFFGHVPLLTDPVFADCLQAIGQKGVEAAAHEGGLVCMARFYWYTVEFGLINTPEGLRVYGAGIISSNGETAYSLTAPQPNRVGFSLDRVMRTDYVNHTYQETYFVVERFEELFAACEGDLAPMIAACAGAPPIAKNAVLPGDRLYPPNAARAVD